MPPAIASFNARLLDACDAAATQHQLDRALTILGELIGVDRRELTTLAIGERDMRLLDARRRYFGDALEALCTCGACGEINEFTIDAADLPRRGDDAVLTFSGDGGRAIRARFPTSLDLAAVIDRDEEAATRALAARCVLDDALPLSDAEVAELDRRLAEADGIAALEITFDCSACGAPDTAPFDITAFLWRDLADRRRRLLTEVDALAYAYGWSEADVLALSDRRRAEYVRLAGR